MVDNPALETNVWSAGSDPDADGLLNYQEAYHGLNPTHFDSHLAALRTEFDGPSNEFFVRWRKSKQTRGINGEFHWSPDLRKWFANGTAPDSSSPSLR